MAQLGLTGSMYDADIRRELGLGGFDVTREGNFYQNQYNQGQLMNQLLQILSQFAPELLTDINLPDWLV